MSNNQPIEIEKNLNKYDSKLHMEAFSPFSFGNANSTCVLPLATLDKSLISLIAAQSKPSDFPSFT